MHLQMICHRHVGKRRYGGLVMKYLSRIRFLKLVLSIFLALPTCAAFTSSASQPAKPKDNRRLGASSNPANSAPNQTKPLAGKPEILVHAGITSRPTQISFRP